MTDITRDANNAAHEKKTGHWASESHTGIDNAARPTPDQFDQLIDAAGEKAATDHNTAVDANKQAFESVMTLSKLRILKEYADLGATTATLYAQDGDAFNRGFTVIGVQDKDGNELTEAPVGRPVPESLQDAVSDDLKDVYHHELGVVAYEDEDDTVTITLAGVPTVTPEDKTFEHFRKISNEAGWDTLMPSVLRAVYNRNNFNDDDLLELDSAHVDDIFEQHISSAIADIEKLLVVPRALGRGVVMFHSDPSEHVHKIAEKAGRPVVGDVLDVIIDRGEIDEHYFQKLGAEDAYAIYVRLTPALDGAGEYITDLIEANNENRFRR